MRRKADDSLRRLVSTLDQTQIVFFDAEGTLWFARPPYSPEDYWNAPGLSSARRVFRLDPEVPRVLQALAEKGIRRVIVSRHVPHRLAELVKEYGLGDQFEEVIVAYDKATAILRYLERQGIPPSQAIMIGDTPDVDYLPVKAVGVSSYLLDRGNAHKTAHFALPRLSSLLDVIGNERFDNISNESNSG
jgi:phosphoglycolate phosphatase-like HAD superfamily hydrolase